MLVNLTPYEPEIERRKQMIAEEPDIFKDYVLQSDPSRLVETGVYTSNLNFGHNEFVEFKDVANIPYKQTYEAFGSGLEQMQKGGDYISQYGVADNLEQIKEYFKEAIDAVDRKFFITISPIFQDRENKGNGGGWRWHKWGPYIGKLNPQCEYLDDEDFGDAFECIFCFHLYEVL